MYRELREREQRQQQLSQLAADMHLQKQIMVRIKHCFLHYGLASAKQLQNSCAMFWGSQTMHCEHVALMR